MSTSYAQSLPGTLQVSTEASSNERGFFGALLDLAFTAVVSRRIIKVLYVVAMILIALTAFVNVVFASHFGSTAGLFTLFIAAPIASFFGSF